MLDQLIPRLKLPQRSTRPRRVGQRTAIGALLVRLARADARYLTVEIAEIDRILRSEYNLSRSKARKLRKRAEDLEAVAVSGEPFVQIIKRNVPYNDRLRVFQALWKVSVSDGIKHQKEEDVIRFVAARLGIDAKDAVSLSMEFA